MIPVDLVHADKLGKALQIGADLAKHYGAKLTYVGVTAPAPGPLGHNPKEFGERLAAFAETQRDAHGHEAAAKAVIAHDPTTEVDDALLNAVEEIGADLVVMASHIPGLADYIWPSNGGKIAGHSRASVFVVRA
jgi:nucleotide-binding universal stress UspA family protein